MLGAELSTETSHQVHSVLSARLAEVPFCARFPLRSSPALCLCRVSSPGFTQCLQANESVDEDLEQRTSVLALAQPMPFCFSDDEGSREERSIYCLDALACSSISSRLRSHCLQSETKSCLSCQYAKHSLNSTNRL